MEPVSAPFALLMLVVGCMLIAAESNPKSVDWLGWMLAFIGAADLAASQVIHALGGG
jgi:hypothetical protein